MINETFNSPHQQNRVKDYLFSLNFNSFLSDGCSPNDALIKLGNTMNTRIHQCPPVFNDEAAKKECLHRVVLQQKDSIRGLANSYTSNLLPRYIRPLWISRFNLSMF